MKLKEVILLTANYYNRTISEQVLNMYAEDLADHDELKVIEAYKAYRKNPKNKTFPLPAQIIEILNPQISLDAQANEITSRIIKSISSIGIEQSRYDELRAFVGEIGMGAIRRLGGWEHICREHGVSIQPNQFYAQLRELIKSNLEIQNNPNVDMEKLLNGVKEVPKALPAPVKFSENETKDLLQKFEGRPVSELNSFVEAMAKQKSLKEGVA